MIKNQIKFVAFLLCATMFMSSCSDDNTESQVDPIEEQIGKMSLREKIGQMFIVRLSALDSTQTNAQIVNSVEYPFYDLPQRCVEFNQQYPCGGIILFAKNISTPSQLKQLTSDLHSKLKNHPLVCIDEEGGRVARIANTEGFNLNKYVSMAAIAETGNPAEAYKAAQYIGGYVKDFGFDIDFAPVTDVNTNPDNIVIGARSFNSDPEVASKYVVNYLQGLWSNQVEGCLKHFPGHGDVANDTHTGYAASNKTWAEMKDCEMITFRAGIAAGAKMIMTAHIAVPNVDSTTKDGYAIPSTMSKVVLQDKLRGELGFKGVVVTDALDMGAITNHYTPAETAVGTIQAGVDILLCPYDYREAFNAVYQAVKNGTISEERINQSVRRILKLKK